VRGHLDLTAEVVLKVMCPGGNRVSGADNARRPASVLVCCVLVNATLLPWAKAGAKAGRARACLCLALRSGWSLLWMCSGSSQCEW